MSRVSRFAGAVAAALTLAAGAASAATLQLATSFDVAVRPSGINAPSGPDTIGLGGARITATATFADGTVFTRNGSAAPRAVASSFTYTVAGASVAGTNGVYQAGTSPGAPTAVGLFFAASSDGFATDGTGANIFTPNPDRGTLSIFGLGLPNTLQFQAEGTTGGPVPLGSALTLPQLQAIRFGPLFSSFSTRGINGTNYVISNFTTVASDLSVSTVPLPASLPMLGAGILAVGALRRRRAKRTA